MDILVNVKNKVAMLATPASIVCGNSDYTITFAFDDEWSAEAIKTARFVYRRGSENKYEDVVFSGNTVNVPVLNNITAVLVGVFAGELRTTTPAVIGCEKSILCGGGTHGEPPEDVYTQLLAVCNELVGVAGNHHSLKNNPHGVTLEQIGAAPAGLVSTKIYPKTYAAFMEELKSIYTNMPNTKNTPKKFVYAGIETGGDMANGELGGGTWFIEINRSSANYGTIKASNEYYGDYKLVIYGSWGKWVNVSPNAFTPSSHANDKNNPHGVTCEQIGAAPSGYGLGETSPKLPPDNNTHSITKSGWYLTNTSTQNAFGTYGVIHANLYDDSNAVLFFYGNGGVTHARKIKRYGTWGEWEYVVLPMNPGVEYRTTERCNGSVVYAKRVEYSVGAIDANSAVVDTSIPHEISNFSYLVRSHCVKDSYVLPYLKDNGGFTAIVGVNSSNITLRVFKANWAASTWYIDLYYVKS